MIFKCLSLSFLLGENKMCYLQKESYSYILNFVLRELVCFYLCFKWVWFNKDSTFAMLYNFLL